MPSKTRRFPCGKLSVSRTTKVSPHARTRNERIPHRPMNAPLPQLCRLLGETMLTYGCDAPQERQDRIARERVSAEASCSSLIAHAGSQPDTVLSQDTVLTRVGVVLSTHTSGDGTQWVEVSGMSMALPCSVALDLARLDTAAGAASPPQRIGVAIVDFSLFQSVLIGGCIMAQ